MLRQSVFAFLLIVVTTLSTPAAAQLDADAVIARHIEARGGAAALRAIRSLVFDRGVYEEGDFRGDGGAVMLLMRPHYKLVGHPERNPEFMEGYDGAAWEWFRDPGIVVRTVGTANEALRHYADVEGPFLDYREKGHRVELAGTEAIAGRPAYRIRLVMMDGYTVDNFFDRESFMLVASRHTVQVHAFGAEVTSETRFEDFRAVSGVIFPFRAREVRVSDGSTMNSMQWGVIEANRDMPARWFSPPEFERTPIQTLMEQLYIQRSDPRSVLWTYRQFRRAHPDIDTREAAEVAGFQSLKMGAHEAAIALLEQNAADHPDAANSAFGLGRAYATAGRPADARVQFERALRLDPNHRRSTEALAAVNAASPR